VTKFKEVDQLSHMQLKIVLDGSFASEDDCGENAEYDVFQGCQCKAGYCFYTTYCKCVYETGYGLSTS